MAGGALRHVARAAGGLAEQGAAHVWPQAPRVAGARHLPLAISERRGGLGLASGEQDHGHACVLVELAK